MKEKHFFTYLKESIALNPVIKPKKGEMELGLETGVKSMMDIPKMREDFEDLKSKKIKNRSFKKKRASILKKYNLKIEDGEIIEKETEQDPLLPGIEISNKTNEFTNAIKRELIEINSMIEENETNYQNNLKILLKRFFSVGGKMPKRYLYLPVSNNVNIREIEKINNNSHLDMLLKIKNGKFVDLNDDDQKVFNYLVKSGYKLTKEQYMRNVCINTNGKEVPIDQELNNIAIIKIEQKKKALEKQTDPKLIERINLEIQKRENYNPEYLATIKKVKQNSDVINNSVIILTWVPRLIMAQSTNTIWQSCMSYHFSGNHGSNVRFVQTGIEQGMFIAWLVNLDDRHITKPIARVLIKPFVNEHLSREDREIFYWPSVIYTSGGQTNIINIFEKVLRAYCTYKQKEILRNVSGSELSVKYLVYPDSGEKELTVYDADNVIETIQKEKSMSSLIKYLRFTLKNTVNLKEHHLQAIIRNKELIDFFNSSGKKGSIDHDLKSENIQIIITKCIEIKKPFLIKTLLDKLSKEMLIETFSIFVRDMVYDSKFSNTMIENINYFKYIIDCFKSVKKEIVQSDMINSAFVLINENCVNKPKLALAVKPLIDVFGYELYGYKQHPNYWTSVSRICGLYYSDMKPNEIKTIVDNLGINEKIFVNKINYIKLYSMNKENFFYLLNDTIFQEKMVPHLLDLLDDLILSDKIKEIEDIFKKSDFNFKKQKYQLTQREEIRFARFFVQLAKNKDFNRLNKLTLERGVDIKEIFLNNIKTKNINLPEFEQFMSHIFRFKEKDLRDMFDVLFVAAANDSIYVQSLIAVVDRMFRKNENIDTIIEYVKRINFTIDSNYISFIISNIIFGMSQYFNVNKINNNKKMELIDLLINKKILDLDELKKSKDSIAVNTAVYELILSGNKKAVDSIILYENGDLDIISVLKFFKFLLTGSFHEKPVLDNIPKLVDYFVEYKKEIVSDDDQIKKFLSAIMFGKESVLLWRLAFFYSIKLLTQKGLIKQQVFDTYMKTITEKIKSDDVIFFKFAINAAMTYEENDAVLFLKSLDQNIAIDKFKNYLLDEEMLAIVNNIDKKSIQAVINLFNKESRDKILNPIIDYVLSRYDHDIDFSNLKKIIEIYHLQENIKTIIKKSIKNQINWYDDGKKLYIINIINNMEFLKDFVERDQMLYFIIKSRENDLINNLKKLLNKKDINDKTMRAMIIDCYDIISDYATYQMYNINAIFVNIFGKQEIDEIIKSTKNKDKILSMLDQ